MAAHTEIRLRLHDERGVPSGDRVFGWAGAMAVISTAHLRDKLGAEAPQCTVEGRPKEGRGTVQHVREASARCKGAEVRRECIERFRRCVVLWLGCALLA